jgi:60 kDa SS-A/Ro ribonucleoprotein
MKFNFFKNKTTTVVNYEGAIAYATTPEYELYAAVVTSGLSDSFYEKEDERLNRIIHLMEKCDNLFIAKLAIYTRTKMNLRSISIVLLVYLAKQKATNFALQNVIPKVVLRADEITELLAYYQIANKRKGVKKLNQLSKQIQKGLAKSFNQFDEYQFAKYNRNAEVKLKDALFLVHPKAKDEAQQLVFNKIATDTLAIPYTWETELSQLGTQAFESTKAKEMALQNTWEALIDSKKLGYMATLRNLRNIVNAKVSYIHIQQVANYLSNETAVLNSKQLPFRFLSAYREMKQIGSAYTSFILDALEDAIAISAKNITGFGLDTSVLIACDVSGSMQKNISAKSSIMYYDIGLVLAMLLKRNCKNVVAGMFGDTWKTVTLGSKNVLANVDAFYKREGEVGYATNGYKVIDYLIDKNISIDKVMLFTDTQLYDASLMGNSISTSWNKYKKMVPQAKLYLFDLAGYGKLPIDIKQNNVHLIAGWSDKIFDVLHALDNQQTALDVIASIEV